jgi:hypothetical protein
MVEKQAAHETKGVTVEFLSTIDLGLEIEGMATGESEYPPSRSNLV